MKKNEKKGKNGVGGWGGYSKSNSKHWGKTLFINKYIKNPTKINTYKIQPTLLKCCTYNIKIACLRSLHRKRKEKILSYKKN